MVDKKELLDKAKKFIKDCSEGILTTIGLDGFPKSRVLEDHNPYGGFGFWFATHRRTRKVEEIKHNNKVNIFYCLAQIEGYICITGEANLREDEAARKKIWRNEWSQYWPEGYSSKDYVPIRITPLRLEYYSIKEKAMQGDSYGPLIIDIIKDDKVS